MVQKEFQPVRWLTVALAALPGLWLALSRRYVAGMESAITVLGYAYLGVLFLGGPIVWWRGRRFPVWALLPAGLITWFFSYLAGTGLWQLYSRYGGTPYRVEVGSMIVLLQLVLAVGLFALGLRGRHVPRRVWVVLGIIILGNIVLALFSRWVGEGKRPFLDMLNYFLLSGLRPLEGFMLVAAGLLLARQHGILAVLFVVGGYGYLCLDSDYLAGPLWRQWSGWSLYVVGMTAGYLVLTPIVLLRAKTQWARVLAVFGPAITFHGLRCLMLSGVMMSAAEWPAGDIVLSLNALLSLSLAWLWYSQMDVSAPDKQLLAPIHGIQSETG